MNVKTSTISFAERRIYAELPKQWQDLIAIFSIPETGSNPFKMSVDLEKKRITIHCIQECEVKQILDLRDSFSQAVYPLLKEDCFVKVVCAEIPQRYKRSRGKGWHISDLYGRTKQLFYDLLDFRQQCAFRCGKEPVTIEIDGENKKLTIYGGLRELMPFLWREGKEAVIKAKDATFGQDWKAYTREYNNPSPVFSGRIYIAPEETVDTVDALLEDCNVYDYSEVVIVKPIGTKKNEALATHVTKLIEENYETFVAAFGVDKFEVYSSPRKVYKVIKIEHAVDIY